MTSLATETMETTETTRFVVRWGNHFCIARGKSAWGDWRLVFDGKEYPPKFKTEYQWRKAMQ